MLSVYGYQAYSHYDDWTKACSSTTPCPSFPPRKTCCTSCARTANIPSWRPEILDLALVLHAEHGGGNNSTFTTHVVTSSGTDTYSAVAASSGQL
ncbi:MAG: citrate/2-methylcitrate synthase [[Clostridium] leptum]